MQAATSNCGNFNNSVILTVDQECTKLSWHLFKFFGRLCLSQHNNPKGLEFKICVKMNASNMSTLRYAQL